MLKLYNQCSSLKSSMPFKRNSALQKIPLSKQPFKTQPQIENEARGGHSIVKLNTTCGQKKYTFGNLHHQNGSKFY